MRRRGRRWVRIGEARWDPSRSTLRESTKLDSKRTVGRPGRARTHRASARAIRTREDVHAHGRSTIRSRCRGARVVSAGVCAATFDTARTRRSSRLVFEKGRASSKQRTTIFARLSDFRDCARLAGRRHTRACATFRVATRRATRPRGVPRACIVDRPSASVSDPRAGFPRISFVVGFPLQQPLLSVSAQIPPPHGGRGVSRALRAGALVHARGPRAAPDAPRRERRAHRLQPPRGARRSRYPRAPPGRARPRWIHILHATLSSERPPATTPPGPPPPHSRTSRACFSSRATPPRRARTRANSPACAVSSARSPSRERAPHASPRWRPSAEPSTSLARTRTISPRSITWCSSALWSPGASPRSWTSSSAPCTRWTPNDGVTADDHLLYRYYGGVALAALGNYRGGRDVPRRHRRARHRVERDRRRRAQKVRVRQSHRGRGGAAAASVRARGGAEGLKRCAGRAYPR